MGGLKTYPAASLLVLWQASFAFAGNPVLNDLPRTFAECAGRYAALTEFLWRFGESPALQTATRRRNDFTDLLNAAEPDLSAPAARSALYLRIEVKASHSALLAAYDYSRTPDQRRQAEIRSDGLLAPCDSLLPGQ